MPKKIIELKKGAYEEKTLSVLHLIGSRVSNYYFNLSWFWSNRIVNPSNTNSYYAIVHPDGLWQLKKSRNDLSEKMPLCDFLNSLPNIDVVVPHMYSFPGMTSYRAFFEDILDIPVVGPDLRATSLATDKSKTKNLLSLAGVLVANSQELRKGEKVKLKPPLVIKPNSEDNSVGVSLITKENQIQEALEYAFEFDDLVIAEDYIPGREIRMGVIDIDDDLWVTPAIEFILSKKHPIRTIHDNFGSISKFDSKNESDGYKISTVCPAKINEQIYEKCSNAVQIAHEVFGCRDYSLWEFRVHEETGEPYLLEATLFWSFSLDSVLSRIIIAAGVNLEDLSFKIWSNASKRIKKGKGSQFKFSLKTDNYSNQTGSKLRKVKSRNFLSKFIYKTYFILKTIIFVLDRRIKLNLGIKGFIKSTYYKISKHRFFLWLKNFFKQKLFLVD